MKLFDLHCDTAFEMYKKGEGLCSNKLHIALDRTKEFETYNQIMAIWSDCDKSDEECFADFKNINSVLKKETEKCFDGNKNSYLISVEDGKLLAGDIKRLDFLYDEGVRFLIPMWSGENCIGGAFDTSKGLSDFGKKVILRCFEIGIVPDISHSSLESASEILDMAEKADKPVIASHSCSYSVYPHDRNLRDEQFLRIKDIGGIVGLSFCRYHLAPKEEKCTSDNILSHIEHYLSIGGENTLCFGADMDGAPMPEDIFGIESIPSLYDKICDAFGKDIADNITWNNAYNFVNSILK